MRPHRTFFLLITVVLVLDTLSLAHHRTPSYDPSRSKTIEGQLVVLTLQNPHVFMLLDVPSSNGQDQKAQRWSIEWLNLGRLAEYGINKDNTIFRVGDRLRITGFPDKLAERELQASTIIRLADNWTWTLKSRPK